MPKMDELPEEELAWSWEAHRRRQIRRGLELTPAERLEWLETTLAQARRILGRARDAENRLRDLR